MLPKLSKKLPASYSPSRRLIAAVVLQAVRDYLYPPKNLSLDDYESAAEFLRTETGLIATLSRCSVNDVNRVVQAARASQSNGPLAKQNNGVST